MTMKKKLLLMTAAALMGATAVQADEQPQITNGDFETWTYDGENLPNNWNSFQTADGSYASMGYSANNRQVQRSTDVRPGSKGQYSCRIWARSVLFGIVAQGNLTTGRVHAGSTSATNAANHNYTDRDGSNTNNGVTNPCAMKFTGRPTLLKAWVKYKPSADISQYGDHATAKISAIIHGDGDYISYGVASNDNDENKALVVAQAVKEIEYNDGEWQQIVIPFEYTDNEVDPAYILVNASTNAYPGAGKANDELYIDDIEVVYAKLFTQDPLYVTVNGVQSGPFDATVYVTENDDNTIDFLMRNFVLEAGDDEMPVGNIRVEGIPVEDVGHGITKFADKQTVQIEAGDDPDAPYWVGTFLGDIPLELSGNYNDEHLYVTIHIPLSDDMVVDVLLGEDLTTGVNSIEEAPTVKGKGVIYDLNGRRVNEMQPGHIYVVNGKKVVK